MSTSQTVDGIQTSLILMEICCDIQAHHGARFTLECSLALVNVGTHVAWVLLDEYSQPRVLVREAYFAHIRFGWPPEIGC